MLFTDSLSLFDVITKATSTAEKRLTIDISVVKEAYRQNELFKLNFIRSEISPADVFTKHGSESILHEMLLNAAIEHPIEQWVGRKNL